MTDNRAAELTNLVGKKVTVILEPEAGIQGKLQQSREDTSVDKRFHIREDGSWVYFRAGDVEKLVKVTTIFGEEYHIYLYYE